MLEKLTSIPGLFFSADAKRLSVWAYLFLLLLCCAFFLPGLISLPPTDRDESLFAQASKQMIESSNYIDIKFQNEPRYKKPIGIYWLQALVVRAVDPRHLNEIWAYRLPSFFGATASVLLTAALGSLLFGPMAGLLAAFMMASCCVLNVEARLAKTDAMLLATVVAAEWALARAYLEQNRTLTNFFIFWGALAAGILIKGPIIAMVLLATILWLRVQEKTLLWLHNLRPWRGLALLLILIAPWFIAIMVFSHGTFATQSAGHDLLTKLWQGKNNAIMPPGLHLLVFPLIFFPSSLFAMLAVPDTWRTRHEPRVSFCLGWIIPSWIIFEMAFTKLPHYVLPTYPAIAILAAKALCEGFPALAKEVNRPLWPAFTASLWLILGVAMATLFCLAPSVITNVTPSVFIIAGCLTLIVIQAFVLYLLPRHRPDAVTLLTMGSLIFMTCVFGSLLPNITPLWISHNVYRAAEAHNPCAPNVHLASTYHEPSLVFLAGTETQVLPDGKDVAAAIIKNPCTLAVLDENQRQTFLDQFTKSPQQPVAITTIDGINMGREQKTHLTLYALPNAAGKP